MKNKIEELNSFIENHNCKITTDLNTVYLNCEEKYNSSELINLMEFLKENENIFLINDNRFIKLNPVSNTSIDQPSKISLSKKELRKNNIFCSKNIKDYINSEIKTNLINFNKERYILLIDSNKKFINSNNSLIKDIDNKYLVYKFIYELADMKDELNAFFILKKPVKIKDISINAESLINVKINTKIEEIKKYFSEDYDKKRACLKKALISTSNKYPSNNISNDIVLSEFDNIYKNTQLKFDRYVASHVQDKLALEIKQISMEIVKSIKEANDNINSAIIAVAANAIILMNFKFEVKDLGQNIVFLIILLCISILETFICSNNLSALSTTKKAMETAKEKMQKKYPKNEKEIDSEFRNHEKKRKFLTGEFISAIVGIWVLFIIIISYFCYKQLNITTPETIIFITSFF
jgi:hypothetical protein